MIHFLFTIFSIFLFTSTGLAQDFSKVSIKTTKVSKNLYMLEGKGGNIGAVAGKEGVYIIDDQFAPLYDKITAALKKLSDQPVKFVINTHWHGDHTGGNEKFGKSGSVIVAHENVRKRMSKKNFTKIFNRETPAAAKAALPVVTFPDKMSIHLNGVEAKIMHFKNAHTDGDSVIYFPSLNAFHTGDIFFNGFYPYIDVDAGGSLKGIIAAVTKILSMSNSRTKIIPGHGPLASKKDLEIYLKMLTQVNSKMAKLVKDGKTVEQIVEMKPLSSLDEKWGKGFMKPEVFTKLTYQSLKK